MNRGQATIRKSYARARIPQRHVQIRVTKGTPVSNELREDGGYELREDGGREIRE